MNNEKSLNNNNNKNKNKNNNEYERKKPSLIFIVVAFSLSVVCKLQAYNNFSLLYSSYNAAPQFLLIIVVFWVLNNF